MSSATHAGLAAELYVSDLARSLRFYVELLGFVVSYERLEERFAAISLGPARIMLSSNRARWRQRPSRRSSAASGGPPRWSSPSGAASTSKSPVAMSRPLQSRSCAGWPALVDLHEKSYRVGDASVRVRQLVIADPDGYLIRPSQLLDEPA